MKLSGMSVVLLVGLEGSSSLYRVSTFEGTPFKVWKDRDGVDFFWRGWRVSRVYSLGESCDYWRELPLYDAMMTLLKRGKAEEVPAMPPKEDLAMPLKEGRLPT